MKPVSVLAILGAPTRFAVVIEWIRRRGFAVHVAATAADGLRAHAEHGADVVLVGLPLPDATSSSVVGELRRCDPDLDVILIGFDAEIGSAAQAIRLGARDWISDPVDGRRDLLFALGVTLGARASDARLQLSRRSDAKAAQWDSLVANTAVMARVVARAKEIAERTTASGAPCVLLSGELGTGKRSLAKAIHYNGGRRDRAFVEIECASGERLGPLLVGDGSRGLLEMTHGGAMFFDEIGAVPLDVQGDLLSIIEDKAIPRARVVADVQIFAATRRDLASMVQRGELRADLYHRLHVVAFELPPLRERIDDLVPLAGALLARLASGYGVPQPRLSDDVRDALRGHTWPANLHELRNELERILLVVDDDPIRGTSVRRGGVAAIDADDVRLAVTLAGTRCPLDQLEREVIRQALLRTGNISRAARYLAITRQTMLYRMKKHGFASPSTPGFPDSSDV